MNPLAAIRRHPLPMRCRFRRSLVVAYAFDADALRPLLPQLLIPDTFTDAGGREWGFAACALVALDGMRVRGMPAWAGSSSIMTGYRIFARMRNRRGRTMRGLKILRSDVDSALIGLGANLTTRYRYRVSRARVEDAPGRVRFVIDSADGSADADISADPASLGAPPPESSPFATPREARRFAGPLPYTFSEDPQGIVVVKSDRTGWTPEGVDVDVSRCGFFDRGPFAGLERRLANAFLLSDVEYGWRAGRLVRHAELEQSA